MLLSLNEAEAAILCLERFVPVVASAPAPHTLPFELQLLELLLVHLYLHHCFYLEDFSSHFLNDKVFQSCRFLLKGNFPCLFFVQLNTVDFLPTGVLGQTLAILTRYNTLSLRTHKK